MNTKTEADLEFDIVDLKTIEQWKIALTKRFKFGQGRYRELDK